jgi:hypothetical protein
MAGGKPGAAGFPLWRTAMGRPDRIYARQSLPLRSGKSLLVPREARLAVPAEIERHIERWNAGEEARLGDRACFIAARGPAQEDRGGLGDLDASEFVAAMKAAWKLVGDATFSPAERLPEPPFLSFDPSSEGGIGGDPKGLFGDEMVALVRLEGEAGRLDLVYSARALYPLTKALESYARFAPQA